MSLGLTGLFTFWRFATYVAGATGARYFHSAWPDLSHVPDQLLRVPSLLMCGTEDEVCDAMQRADRSEHSRFMKLDGEDHVTSFLSARARTTYRDFLQDLDV